MSDFISVCERAAKTGGEVLLQWQGKFRVREKGPADLVTEADVASQKAIQEVVLGAFPGHQFLGEEDSTEPAASKSSASPGGFRWIVDPLDGTTNYVHGLAAYSVSVALEKDGQLLAGTVYDPVTRDCFSAAAGQGAFLNGKRLTVSRATRLSDSLVAVSFAAQVSRDSPEILDFLEVLECCQAVRRLGSAALNLAYVAAGWIDVYWSSSCKLWDIAAGLLMVREAGGVVTSMDGGPIDFSQAQPRFAISATQDLHVEVLEVLNRAAEARARRKPDA